MSAMVDLPKMLAVRERRAMRQRELLETYRLPLISFTMNIAGPVKNSPIIRQGFRLGVKLLSLQLARLKAAVLFSEETDEDTGCEGLYVVNLSPKELKNLTCSIEDGAELGRLFDLDVIAPDGTKLDRKEPRTCIICGAPAKECARSRTHTVGELQTRTDEMLKSALKNDDAETAASLAVRALLYEVCTTPKPGLVDRTNNGSHQDMDLFTFLNSSAALWPYFAECVRIGRDTSATPAPETFAVLRNAGKLAEGKMFLSTGSVNTHKGAIFSMGLACAALGRLDRDKWSNPSHVLGQISAMTMGMMERELSDITEDTAVTAGQRFYLRYGITGVRGQAEMGFPAVLAHGLPVLEQGFLLGKSMDEAGAAALLSLLAHTTDTNMIARGGIDTQREISERLRTLLAECPYPDKETLLALDQEFIARNLSPGGSADLLALCYLLHFLKGIQ